MSSSLTNRHERCRIDFVKRPECVTQRGMTHLAGVVVLHLPASGQLHLFVGEHVEEGHQVPVVLVALEMMSIPANLTDHVLQTSVGGEHAVGTLRGRRQEEEGTQNHQRKESFPTMELWNHLQLCLCKGLY